MQAALATAVWTAATAATITFAGPASADPAVGACDAPTHAVAASSAQPGLGHRAVQLNFTLRSTGPRGPMWPCASHRPECRRHSPSRSRSGATRASATCRSTRWPAT